MHLPDKTRKLLIEGPRHLKGSVMARTLFAEEELYDLYKRQRLSLRAIAQSKGCHRETVRQYLILYGIPRRTVAEAKIKHPRQSFSGDPREKAYLLGFRAGDLYVHKANYSDTSQTVTVACTSTVPEQIELIRSLFEPYGAINLSEGKKQTVITCYLDPSFSFLLEKDDRIPPWVLSNRDNFAAYLAGYMDAEGCIQVKRHTGAAEVIMRSCDVNILRTCWTTLQELGIVCPPVYLVKPEGERDADGPLYRKDYWGLGIYRRESLCRLFSLVAPYMKHPKRRRDMMAAWENAKARLGHFEEDNR
jgi:hypothetical protein